MRKTLIIIDAQIDFIRGSLAVKGAEEAIQNLVKYIRGYGKEYHTIIVTKDWHIKNHPSFKEYGGIWPEHCVEYSFGAELPNSLEDAIRWADCVTTTIKKGNTEKAYSAFEEIDNGVKNLLSNSDEIHVCGIAGDYCVKESIKDLIKHGYNNISVIKECIASIDEKEFENFLNEKNILGINEVKRTFHGKIDFGH